MVRPFLAASIAFGAFAFPTRAADAPVRPTDPAGLAVLVAPGTLDAPGGKRVEAPQARLAIAPPEVRDGKATGPTPPDFAGFMESYDGWPNTFGLSPKRDESGTLILGGVYRMILPESVVVTSADGSKTFKRDEDYRLNADWAQIANVKGRLGKPKAGEVAATFKVATQRLDLVQIDGKGAASVKRGKPVLVCPTLPAPDAGHTALAGVYVAPWRRDGAWVVTAEDVFPIAKADPVAPANPAALAKSVERLKAGQELKVAFMGDSVTLGAEAPRWHEGFGTEKNRAYASRVVTGLRKQFPKATVTPIAAFKGGTSTKAAAGMMKETVVPAKADLLLIAFGLNDANGPIGKPANNPPEAYKADVRALVREAKSAGMDVLLVTPMQPSPFMRNGIAGRIPAYRQALLELATEENVACADVYTAWMHQAKAGVPPFSQLHNWINHPGEAGHAVYAETVLASFRQ